MLVYDITDVKSFHAIEDWLSEVDKLASPNVIKLLIGNKADLAGQRQVPYEEGLALAKRCGMNFMETSAKSATNVQESFRAMTQEIYNRIIKTQTGTPKPTPDGTIRNF